MYPSRAGNCLKSRNYSLLNHLSGLSKKDLLEINNMGRGTAGEIIKKINDFLDENKALYDEELAFMIFRSLEVKQKTN
ncbi:MAG: DNA-directed RNA polymerase subunit alpha C-terminal domain-containing protein [Anaerovoracaceae bacterium]